MLLQWLEVGVRSVGGHATRLTPQDKRPISRSTDARTHVSSVMRKERASAGGDDTPAAAAAADGRAGVSALACGASVAVSEKRTVRARLPGREKRMKTRPRVHDSKRRATRIWCVVLYWGKGWDASGGCVCCALTLIDRWRRKEEGQTRGRLVGWLVG